MPYGLHFHRQKKCQRFLLGIRIALVPIFPQRFHNLTKTVYFSRIFGKIIKFHDFSRTGKIIVLFPYFPNTKKKKKKKKNPRRPSSVAVVVNKIKFYSN